MLFQTKATELETLSHIFETYFNNDYIKNYSFLECKDDSIQPIFAKNNDGAFFANSQTVVISEIEQSKPYLFIPEDQKGQILFRYAISTHVTKAIMNGNLKMQFSFIKLIDMALDVAARYVKLKECSIVSFLHPDGRANVRELDNGAGYEFRLYVKID